MFSVRHSNGFRLAASAAALLFLTPGCSSNSFLARFAPPGVVKYEDIAGDKPPNPAIEETVREYRADTQSRFPVLSQTPTSNPAPQIPESEIRDAQKAALIEGRERLAEEIAGDEAAVEAEEARTAITSRGERFNDQLERDDAAAKAERREDLGGDAPQQP